MRETDYAYADAFVRTLENRMLTTENREQLIQASGLADAMRILAEQGYAGGEIWPARDREKLLQKEWETVWDEVRNALPEQAPLEFFLYFHDYQNTKLVIKALHAGLPWQGLSIQPCTIQPAVVEQAILTQEWGLLPDFLQRPAAEAVQALMRTGDGQLCDVLLDRAAYEAVIQFSAREKNPFLSRWLELKCTLVNLNIILRAVRTGEQEPVLRQALIPFGSLDPEGLLSAAQQGEAALLEWITAGGWEEAAKAAGSSLADFEKWANSQEDSYLDTARFQAFGFAPVFSFLKAKEKELGTIRLILSGLAYEMTADQIRERVSSFNE